MPVVDADYGNTIEAFRGHLAYGTHPTAYELKTAIAVIQDAVSRFGSGNTGNTDAQGAIADVVAAIEVLDAAACATNAGADAAAVIATAVTDLEAAATALAGDAIDVPTYVVNTLADG